MAKVTFDGPNKIIQVANGVTELDVQIDLYSDWKEWVQSGNSQYLQAFTAIGGDPITATLSVGITYFLENGWRIKPWSWNHKLVVDGNLYTREEGGDPFLDTDSNARVTIQQTVSNLVDLVTPDLTANVTIDARGIANTVWDKPLAEIVTTDTTGDKLKKDLTKNQFLALGD